jgi:hypothetical protein
MAEKYWLQVFKLGADGKPGAFIGHHIVSAERAEEEIRPLSQVERFVAMRTVCDVDASTSASDMYAAYCEWAGSENVELVSQTHFGRQMNAFGHPSERHGKQSRKHYLGIKLVPPGDTAMILRVTASNISQQALEV